MGARRQLCALPNHWCGVGTSMGACHSSMGGSSSSVGGGVVAVPGHCRMWVLGHRLWGLGCVVVLRGGWSLFEGGEVSMKGGGRGRE